MRRNSIIRMGALAPVLALVIGVVGATSASAVGTTDVPPIIGTPVVAVATAVDSTSVSTVQSATFKYIEVMNVMAKGLPAKYQAHCITLKKRGVTYRIAGSSFRVGVSYWTTYKYKKNGQVVIGWHKKAALLGDKFCVVGNKVIRVQCGNTSGSAKVAPGPVIVGTIKLVKAFTLKAIATAKSVSDVTVTVSAHCDSGSSQASATASAHATATASASATAYATTSVLVIAKAKTAANLALTASIKESAKTNAIAQATTDARAEVMAMVVCTATPPPPPVNRPPTIIILNAPQHVIASVQQCALANDPDGDSLLVTFSAKYGTTSTPFRPDPVGAPQKWCTQYIVPGNSFPDEVITATASDGALSASDSTAPFPIVPSPGN